MVHRHFSVEATKCHSQKGTAIVTGSSRGMYALPFLVTLPSCVKYPHSDRTNSGEAIARRLASDGYAVAINDIAANKAGIEKLVSELNETYGDRIATGAISDVVSLSDVKAMVETAVTQLGPLTVMVANAGICEVGEAVDIDESLAQLMNVNVTGVWNCYTNAARQMIAQVPAPKGSNGYKILGASSIAAYKPFGLLAPYCASKWAVRGMTQVFAIEMARHGINVNCYAPGIVGTAMWEKLDEKLGEIYGRPKGEMVKKSVDELTAMGRVSVPEDVSKAVGFLCGPDSEFVTGQNIVVDGGIVFSWKMSACLGYKVVQLLN